VASAEETLTVTVHVTSHTKISPKDLAAAEAYASAIYHAAGIETFWTDAPWTPADAMSTHLSVLLLSPKMAEDRCRREGLGDGVMGRASSDAVEGGAGVAYIFAGRIAQVARSYRARLDRTLGHVLAHEVGHLLIGADSHASTGVMKASWNPEDSHRQTFTRDHVEIIRRRMLLRGASEADALPSNAQE
jgi:hypothetical protein